MVRRELGIIRCMLNCLLSIVAGFLWRVEGGGKDTKKDDGADRMRVVWDVVTCSAHEGVTFNLWGQAPFAVTERFGDGAMELIAAPRRLCWLGLPSAATMRQIDCWNGLTLVISFALFHSGGVPEL